MCGITPSIYQGKFILVLSVNSIKIHPCLPHYHVTTTPSVGWHDIHPNQLIIRRTLDSCSIRITYVFFKLTFNDQYYFFFSFLWVATCTPHSPSCLGVQERPPHLFPWHQPTHSSLYMVSLASQISGTTHAGHWCGLGRNQAQLSNLRVMNGIINEVLNDNGSFLMM